MLSPARALRQRRKSPASGPKVPPRGAPPRPEPDQALIEARTRSIGARVHEVFPGNIDPALLGWAERAMVRAPRAPTGDFRTWDVITAWATGIAGVLRDAGDRTEAG